MKIIILLSMLLGAHAASAGPGNLVCTIRNARVVIPIARNHSGFDKNNHCSVSCMLSLRCSRSEVMLAGYFKEFQDLMGAGNAEQEDIVADKVGIALVKNGRAKTDQACLEQCDLKYP